MEANEHDEEMQGGSRLLHRTVQRRWWLHFMINIYSFIMVLPLLWKAIKMNICNKPHTHGSYYTRVAAVHPNCVPEKLINGFPYWGLGNWSSARPHYAHVCPSSSRLSSELNIQAAAVIIHNLVQIFRSWRGALCGCCVLTGDADEKMKRWWCSARRHNSKHSESKPRVAAGTQRQAAFNSHLLRVQSPNGY